MVYRQSPHQLSFESFGCGLSTPLSPDNEWVRLADIFPWKELDEAYQLEFSKKKYWARGQAISDALWCWTDSESNETNRSRCR